MGEADTHIVLSEGGRLVDDAGPAVVGDVGVDADLEGALVVVEVGEERLVGGAPDGGTGEGGKDLEERRLVF